MTKKYRILLLGMSMIVAGLVCALVGLPKNAILWGALSMALVLGGTVLNFIADRLNR